MKPYEEIKEEVKKDLVSQYEFWNGQDSQYALQEKEKIQKYLNNLDEYTKQEIMRRATSFARTAARARVDVKIPIWSKDVEPFLEIVGEDVEKLNDWVKIVSIDGEQLEWRDSVRSTTYSIAINEICRVVAKEYEINFTPFERGHFTPLDIDILEGKDVDIALEKGSDETEEHFIDRKEQYELQRCTLGYSVGTFESDIREKYNEEREQLKKQQENIKSVEIKEEEKKEEIKPVEIKEEQIKEEMGPKMSRREELAYIGSGEKGENQIKSQYEKLKKAYNDLSPLKKAWYKATKKAVKMDGEWMIDEPIVIGEENGRSFR